MVCILEWNGVSYILMRNRMISLNANWTTAKTWIGDDLSVKLYDVDYFIGLENLYHLLRQAEYQANLFCAYNNSNSRGWIYYGQFSVGPEDSSYALTYSYTVANNEYLDNGFSKKAPVVFSTKDHDPYSCNHSYPGWYDSDCGGYSLFADKVVWPVGGLDRNINTLNIALTRISNFTVNWLFCPCGLPLSPLCLVFFTVTYKNKRGKLLSNLLTIFITVKVVLVS